MMITKNPKVSVVVAVYNAEEFIQSTIKSVLSQTFDDFELILLDDASSDASLSVMKQFNDKRIRVLQNDKNLGISKTRNKLLDAANGEYIAVLDHDDICLPDRLKEQVKFLDNNPDIDMVGSWFELYCPKNAVWWRRLIVNCGWVWCHPQNPTLLDAWQGNVVMHPTMMFRKQCLDNLGIRYREEYSPAEDYDLVFQMFEKGKKMANIKKILVKYTLHGNNLSIRAKDNMRIADKKVKNNIAKIMHKKPRFFYPYFLVIAKKLKLKFMVKEQDV